MVFWVVVKCDAYKDLKNTTILDFTLKQESPQIYTWILSELLSK